MFRESRLHYYYTRPETAMRPDYSFQREINGRPNCIPSKREQIRIAFPTILLLL